jgi:hypothetical protein
MTRLQFFVIVALLVIMVFGGLGLRSLDRIADRRELEPLTVAPIHGIETSWRSNRGDHRIWSITGTSTDYHAWLDDHVAAFTAAQQILPPLATR